MDTQSTKEVLSLLSRVAGSLDQLVQIFAHSTKLNEQHLAIAMGQVQQIDFSTLPEDVQSGVLKQFPQGSPNVVSAEGEANTAGPTTTDATADPQPTAEASTAQDAPVENQGQDASTNEGNGQSSEEPSTSSGEAGTSDQSQGQ